MIENLVKSSDFISVNTVEEEIAEELLFSSVWCKYTAVIISYCQIFIAVSPPLYTMTKLDYENYANIERGIILGVSKQRKY